MIGCLNQRERVPVSDKAVENKFSKFCEATPEEREFHFLTKTALQEIAKVKKVKLTSTMSISRIIATLGNPPPLTTTEVTAATTSDDVYDETSTESKVIKSILAKSFQPHQKGKLREHCTIGHKLELPILSKFCKELDDPPRGHPHYYSKVRSAFTAGLVEKVNEPWAKDSIDFLILVQDISIDDDDDNEEMWGVEIKTRVTTKSAATEDEHLLATDREKHEVIDFKDTYRYIKDISERYQILHHAYVYNLEKVIIIIGGKSSELIQSTHQVKFTPDIKASYGRVLHIIKKIGLSWLPFYKSDSHENGERQEEANKDFEINESILKVADSIKTLNGREALLSSIHLIDAMLNKPLPLPSCRHIIPIYCAYWNAVKGGSDTTTKLMDGKFLNPPRCWTNGSSTAVSRIIMIQMVLIHRLNQVFNGDKSYSEYASLSNWRNAASHRSTFYDTLNDVRAFFDDELHKFNSRVTNKAAVVETTPPPPARRTNPRRKRVNGVIPMIPDYVSSKTGHTPPKMMSQKINKNKVHQVIADRWHNCTGRPAKIYKYRDDDKRKDRYRRKCDYCKQYQTSWYCLECKGWFCMEPHDNTDNYGGLIEVDMPVEMTQLERKEEEKKQTTAQRNEKRKAKGTDLMKDGKRQRKDLSICLEAKETFEVTCWMMRHSDAWRQKDERNLARNPN